MDHQKKEFTDVLIIGCGGAGLRAAIEIKQSGLSLKVLGKRKKVDAHTVLAAGGVNAALGNLDPGDTWEKHFVDTFIEGYSLGDPYSVEIMTKNSPLRVNEIDKWGANFDKLSNGKLNQRYFGAHTFRRTCFSGDFTGQSILNTLLKKSESLGIPIIDNQYVTDLIIKDSQCFGAVSFDINTGERNIHIANSVILCTGGHTKIWKKSSSRKDENTGDGILLGLKAGCEIIDMEMVQFHPTGMVLPLEMAGTLVTEAVRGEGGKLLNSRGERFMRNYDSLRMELSSRDMVALANYNEIIEGRGTKNDAVLLDISHKDKDFIINKIPKIYEQFMETQNKDISKEPMEVAPTAHYSMGGLLVSAHDHQTNIKGLFAAGEVVGGLHGANRLGGNSLSEILVFGQIAGKAASEFSKSQKLKFPSNKLIKKYNVNINKKIKNGKYDCTLLQQELSEIMWEYCGVVKENEKLNIGLKKLNLLKKSFLDINVNVSKKDCKDLINIFNFEASIISAEATLRSAILRKESRGAHQRSDYKSNQEKFLYNIKVKLIQDKLNFSKNKFSKLSKALRNEIHLTKPINHFTGRLLE